MAERTFKQIASGQRRSLRTTATKLREMAYQWADLDEGNGGMLHGLADKVGAAALDLYTGEEDAF